jgi:subtilisin family serine protease
MNVRIFSGTTLVLGIFLLLAGYGSGLAQPPSKASQAVTDRVADEGRTRVIVQLDLASGSQGTGRPSAERLSARRNEIAAQHGRLRALLRGKGHRVIHEFKHIPYAALDIDASSLAALESVDSPAARVFEDRLLAPTLAQSVPLIEADLAHISGLNGEGAVVAVIDSGVDSAHPFLAGRLVEEACYANGEIGAGDCPNGQATQTGSGAAAACSFAPSACRHGTHVAGIAAGAGSTFSGVAPGADLLAIQVFHASLDCLFPFEEVPCPRAFASDIIAALEHVYEARDRYDIAAVNMSLGGTAYDSACDAESPFFAAVIDNLKSVGIATVAASGNDGLGNGIAEPACIASAISVGATDESDEVAWFSNVSADLDLFAPGTLIYSSVPGGLFENLEGTSMAAPHVAGAWAVYRQAFPTATVDEALANFVDTGVPITDWRSGETKPRIRVGAALGVESPIPAIDSVSPTEAIAYGPDLTLTVNGSGFVRASRVLVNGTSVTTTYVSDTELTATVPASEIAISDSTLPVSVFTPAPGGGTSSEQSLDLLASTLQVDLTAVNPNDVVSVAVTNPPGWPNDWLALALVGSPATEYVAFVYLDASAPTWAVNMPDTGGVYEFRLFVNNSYTQVAVSAPVTVDAGEPAVATLTPGTTTATTGEAVTVTLADSPGGAQDWLSLALVGSPANSYVAYTYVGDGVSDRTWTVNMPDTEGEYEFRLFLDNGYTQAGVSVPVSVEESEPAVATLTPGTTTATTGEAVTVTLADGAGGAQDWLALALVGSPANSYVAYTYVGAGVTDRTWTVDMPNTPGVYEFRLFLDNGYTQAGVSAAVTVDAGEPEPAAATLIPGTTTAAPGEAVTVTLADSPGGAQDWLALALVGSPANSHVAFAYVGDGVTDRTWTVNMPDTEGVYEFRLFLDNGYTQAGVSAPVTVGAGEPEPAAATLIPGTTTAVPGEAVTVMLADSPGGAQDWLALALVGSPANSYLAYTYVGAGVTDRAWTVNMPQTPGVYEFRLFLDNGHTQAGVSAPVTVETGEPEPAAATLTPSTTTAVPGEAVTVTLADGPGGASDWLALALVGSPSSSYVAYTYVGGGVTDRTWTVNMPLTPGAYEFRLFLNNSYTQAGASASVLVQ